MCVPKCHQKIVQSLSRREFLKTLGLAATAAVAVNPATALAAVATESRPLPSPVQSIPPLQVGFFSKVVDLTHTLTPEFPTFGGQPQLELEMLVTLAKDGYNIYQWTLNEHTGTHMDAPFHFSDQTTADKIPVSDLIGPLAVVDIRAKAEEDPDALVTPEDLQAWEKSYGELPPGAIVAMLSGWDANVTGDKFRNADDQGVMHFPGFGLEAIDFLLKERDVKGIMVDTLSLDNGPSTTFDVHYNWLPANKWGMECVANLSQLPPFGATVFVGGPKIGGASGGPSRVIALV
ncbi:MAG: cyclase family protein [Anaerolineae bacterium]